jgi:phytoene/squalene synthetase
METGMADFAHHAATSSTILYLTSIEEYDLYYHYVAGLVGEGLSCLFAATEKESSWIANQLVLSNSYSKRPTSFATATRNVTFGLGRFGQRMGSPDPRRCKHRATINKRYGP